MKPEHITFSSPDLDARITAGILEHRTSEAVVRLADPAGRPLPGVVVEVEQTSSDFLFGANIFQLGGYPTDALNDRYAEAFTGLFNSATVPFYWREWYDKGCDFFGYAWGSPPDFRTRATRPTCRSAVKPFKR